MKYAAALAVLIAWELSSIFLGLGGTLIPSPSAISKTAWSMTLSGELYTHLLASLERVTLGFILGVSTAFLSAIICQKERFVGAGIGIILRILRPIPPIAWIPIAILWFGLGNPSAIFIVAVGAFFPFFAATYDGLDAIPNELKNVGRSLGAKGWLQFRHIELPSLVPALRTGLQVALGMAWMSVIAAELVGAQSGLGYVIQSNRLLLNTEKIFVGMAFIGIVGFMMSIALNLVFDYMAPWSRNSGGQTK